MIRACKHCGAPLPPHPTGKGKGQVRKFCPGACASEFVKAKARAAWRPKERIQRPAFAGSATELASRAKEIERDPALRAARARVRMIRDDQPKTVAQMLREIEDTRRKR